MPSPHEETIFNRALALPQQDRAAFLDRECAGDATLRALVDTLLRAHTQARSFLEKPAPEIAATTIQEAARGEEKPGHWIGRYKLLQLIGEGGCGSVYMAEQEEPVRRRVALKVIKLGMDTKAVIARFEAERQALAMMDHPNIARVLDAGATETGRPFFVMELVRGVLITRYCDENNLNMAARLELFSQVCHALQHAHQKGIIHRDVKPSNILVTIHDGEPMPKVIDFGIAKATQGRLTDQTLFTALEQFIGTPAYMSPEQAEMSALDVDTRSDIYSLGVLLYELLTGQPPFDPKTFVSAGIDEMRRIIREVEPPRPSSRLSTLTAADRSTIARLRGSVPAQLSTQLSGDLDWIVMKALDKNRTRRYESASAFAADIQRYLRNEPVIARPPSTAYLLGKLVRRHRMAVVATSAVAAALVLGLAVATWSFLQERAARERAVTAEQEQARMRQQAELARNNEARQREQAEASRERALAAEREQSRLRELAETQRALAEQARNAETEQRRQAETNEKKAKTEAAKSDQAFKFMGRMLQGVGPSVAVGRDTVLLREILEKTAKRIDTDLKEQPAIAAGIRATLAGVYFDLGEIDRAEAMAHEAMAIVERTDLRQSEEGAAALCVMGVAALQRGRPAETEKFAREALAVARQLPGAKEENLAQALFLLGSALSSQGKFAEAESVLRESLGHARGMPDQDMGPAEAVQMLLGSVLQRQGRLGESETLLKEAILLQEKRLGAEHPMVNYSKAGLANVLMMQDKLAEAEALLSGVLAALKKTLGPEHPSVAQVLPNRGVLALRQRKPAEAVTLLREAVALQTKVLGADHPALTMTRALLAEALQQTEKKEEAAALQRETAAQQQKTYSSEEQARADARITSGVAAWRESRWAAAEADLRAGLPVAQQVNGRSHPLMLEGQRMLADAIYRQRRPAEAEIMLTEMLAECRKAFGNQSSHVSGALVWLGRAQQAQEKLPEAEASLREALAITKTLTASGQVAAVGDVTLLLATICARRGNAAEASSLATEAAKLARTLPENRRDLTLSAAMAGANEMRDAGKFAAEEDIYRLLTTFVRARDGQASLAVAQQLNYLSSALLRTGKFAEAETVARESATQRRQLLPAGSWLSANTESKVGQALVAQKKYAEAEPILLASFAEQQRLKPSGPANAIASWQRALRDNAQTLAALYEATAQPAKAAEWKAKAATEK